jgi:hypothetical protein
VGIFDGNELPDGTKLGAGEGSSEGSILPEG